MLFFSWFVWLFLLFNVQVNAKSQKWKFNSCNWGKWSFLLFCLFVCLFFCLCAKFYFFFSMTQLLFWSSFTVAFKDHFPMQRSYSQTLEINSFHKISKDHWWKLVQKTPISQSPQICSARTRSPSPCRSRSLSSFNMASVFLVPEVLTNNCK